ncbi:MAG: UDP-N-acetylmuramoyl-tripeptide--D-alanyl-D-alanine ligase [Propionicimonas sp.]|nr:UDP-N-acetylmuramoyl-tripeptide--D-alanyl-D-alanine ligase [Propionicimonas sp.]MEA4943011.1 UDP-N-acetylmuramoyl-tripeptide--D-alanyl-D-alanine ligase [Propionicimonas sp.]MEA5054324.1 UDP-N-acetylmuramoyl-tripeptide--D-alanyl-D-alanine ligase [Propionicimonas sp.]
MDELTAAEVAALAGADLWGDPAAVLGPDVVIDSRAAGPGSIFVALPGEHADGHDYAPAALARGAGAVLVSHQLDLDLPQLVVPDPLAGLTALATGLVARARARGLRTIALTGSSGKTSTKDLLASVLATVGAVVAPVGSFNNEIGVPLTATGVNRTTDYLIAELGARGQGHIRALCAVVPPEIGLVLNVGHAHLGEFGSVAGIAQAKGELVEAVPTGGWAVLNADDPLVLAMAARTSARIATFSALGRPEVGELRVWAQDVVAGPLQRYSFTLHTDAASAPVSLLVTGAHQVANALAAAAVGLVAGMAVGQLAAALGAAAPASKWRMEVHRRPDGALVVNDAYNANPDSMRAALTTLAGMRQDGGRLVAVLGDMLELGPGAAAEHTAVGELAGRLGIDEVIAVGGFAADLAAGARAADTRARVVADREEAGRAAAGLVSAGDVVLVKASRGLALETVAERLVAATPTEGVQA